MSSKLKNKDKDDQAISLSLSIEPQVPSALADKRALERTIPLFRKTLKEKGFQQHTDNTMIKTLDRDERIAVSTKRDIITISLNDKCLYSDQALGSLPPLLKDLLSLLQKELNKVLEITFKVNVIE
jgi:hypothetical protein